jgi:hypothetical protein
VGDNAAHSSESAMRLLLLPALVAPLTLGACAVVDVAGAAAGAAISVTGAVVSTTVKVTGKVVEKTIDAVTPDGKPDPEPPKKD